MDHFLPWVGDNYNSQKKKLMIVGESHYGYKNVKNWSRATIDVVNNYLGDKNIGDNQWKRIFTSLAKICNNKDEISKEDRMNFWKSIVYYNYIPESLGKPGDRPTVKLFQNGINPFKKVLNEYKPDYVLVCGRQLWFNIPEEFGEKGPEDYFWYFPFGNDKKAISTYIYHPSRYPQGRSNRISKEIYKKLLSY